MAISQTLEQLQYRNWNVLKFNSIFFKTALFFAHSTHVRTSVSQRSKSWCFIYTSSFMILVMVSVGTWLKKDSLLTLISLFIVFILWWKANFLIMELLASFPDDSEVSSSLLKRFNNSVIDPKYLLKIAAITIYPFQATLYFLVYYYFYLESTAYMVSKMVWSYNQH